VKIRLKCSISGHAEDGVQDTLRHRSSRAFTLVEVLVCLLIMGVSLGGILAVYIESAVRSDFAAYSLSAQMMAIGGMEQARAAKYDPLGSPPTDLLVSTNFPVKTDILDVSSKSSAVAYGTNITTISVISTNPFIKMIRVDCAWSFPQRGVFTNSAVTYRSANQ
jgi:prepilin-type N-terminal cleavage/methylation domain-containing protein